MNADDSQQSESRTPSAPQETAARVAEDGRRLIRRIHKLIRTRYVFVGLALVMSIIGYYFVVDALDSRSNFNFFGDLKRLFGREQYTFYSGSKGGFYIRMGETLEQRTEEEGNVQFKNVSTRGAIDNARRVSSHPKSFGLVQEDTLAKDDFLREHLRFVTPLYLERMHIIYDTESYKRIITQRRAEEWKKQNATGDSRASNESTSSDSTASNDESSIKQVDPRALLTLGPRTGADDDVHYFFEHAKISMGPVGSGSRLFAKYLLSHCGIDTSKAQSLSFKEALARMNADATDEIKVDIVFTIAGAPLDEVKAKLLSDGRRRFKLMSIDPSTVPALNQKYNLRLHNASFKDKYQQGEAISTFGSWAFLIASKDVSDAAVSEALMELEKSKQDIQRVMGIDDDAAFQLSEFNFYETAKSNAVGFRMRFLRNFIVFVTFITLSTIAITTFFSWLISGFIKVWFYRQLTAVYRSLPENARLTESNGVPSPVIYADQKEIISDLVKGMSQLLTLAARVRSAYNDGELRIGHYSFLLDNVESLRAIFQRNMAQRLNEYYANYGEFDSVSLRHYFTAGYLAAGECRALEDKYGESAKQSTEVASDVTTSATFSVGDDEYAYTPKVFISYRREDSNFAAGRIRERLIAQFGSDSVFQDVDIPAGHDFRHVLQREVSRSDVLLVIIGEAWGTSLMKRSRSKKDYLLYEVETALEYGIPVIPVLLAPARLPYENELPESIREIRWRNALTIRPDPEFSSSVDRLIAELWRTITISDATNDDDEGEVQSTAVVKRKMVAKKKSPRTGKPK